MKELDLKTKGSDSKMCFNIYGLCDIGQITSHIWVLVLYFLRLLERLNDVIYVKKLSQDLKHRTHLINYSYHHYRH